MADNHIVPFLAYPGGKRWLARRIIDMLPPHTCYCEPFGGMGAVLLAKPQSRVEVWNDIDGDLANVMRIVRYHPGALAEELQWMLFHRGERSRWLALPGETDIQRAARWIMIRHSSFSALPTGAFRLFRKSRHKPLDVLIKQMLRVSKRLASVVIECLPWQRVMELYDGPETVFFCDPPYASADKALYLHPFTEADHLALRDRLCSLRGQWILTYDDCPLIRDLYSDCKIEEVRRMRVINHAARKEIVELIIKPS